MRRILVLFLLLVSGIAAAADTPPPQPTIENLTAIAANGKVSVRFNLAGAFRNGEMVEALESGLPTTFTYSIEIFRSRPYWLDKGIAKARIEVVCTYNSLTREYLLNYRRDRKLVRTQTFTEFASLIRSMTRIEEPNLFEIGTRRPYKLKVAVKADLMRGWLMYVIPWEVSTRWTETRVRVAEP